MWCDLHNFRASPDEVRGRLSKLTRRFLTNSLSTRWVYLFTFWVGNGQKTFQKLKRFLWLSGRSVNAPFKSGGETIFQPAKSFFSHIQTYCCGPTAFGWGLGWLNAPWLCEWWCSHTWDGHRMVMGVSTGNTPKGGSRGLKALPSVTAPALANPWHASAMRPSPQPNAVVEEIYNKTFFTGWFFFPPDRIEAQPEKTFQPLKSIFFERAPPWCVR